MVGRDIHRGHPRCRPARPTTEVGVPQSIIDGAAYRSANWILVGKTQGRGMLDCRHEFARPVKDIYLKPLRPDWKTVLNQWRHTTTERGCTTDVW